MRRDTASMAVGFRIDYSRAQQFDANGDPYSGALLYVYDNGTTTPKTVYSDRAVTATAANPIVADSSGRFPVRYVAADDLMTLVLKTSAGVTIWSDDNFEPVASTENADLALYLPLAGGTLTGPVRFAEGAAVASATSINLDAATGNFLHITGTTTIATITLAQGALRWCVFDGVLTLTHSANLLLGGVSFATHAGMVLVFMGEGSGVTRLIGGMTASGRSIVESVAVTIGVGDQTTAIAAGTNKRRWRSPFAWTVTAIRASLATAQASGANLVTVDVNNAGNSMLSTKVTLDNNETTSTTATTASVIDTTYDDIADDALIAVDIDNCDGSTTAAGLDVTLIGYKFNLI